AAKQARNPPLCEKFPRRKTGSSTIAHAPSSRYKMRRGKNTKEKIQIQIRLAKTETRSKAHCARLRPEHHLVSKTNTRRAEKQATRHQQPTSAPPALALLHAFPRSAKSSPIEIAIQTVSAPLLLPNSSPQKIYEGRTHRIKSALPAASPSLHVSSPKKDHVYLELCVQALERGEVGPVAEAGEFCSGLHFELDWMMKRGSGGKTTRTPCVRSHTPRIGASNGMAVDREDDEAGGGGTSRGMQGWGVVEKGGREGECETWVGNKAGTYNAAKKASASKPSTPIR
ncbi:hypothetical protein B0H13DRAFT_2556795, partial [Mycena leptocephala]